MSRQWCRGSRFHLHYECCHLLLKSTEHALCRRMNRNIWFHPFKWSYVAVMCHRSDREGQFVVAQLSFLFTFINWYYSKVWLFNSGSEGVKFGCYAVHRAVLCKLWSRHTHRGSALQSAELRALARRQAHTPHTQLRAYRFFQPPPPPVTLSLFLLRHWFSCGPGMTGAGPRNGEHHALFFFLSETGCGLVVMWRAIQRVFMRRVCSAGKSNGSNNRSLVFGISIQVSLSDIVWFSFLLFCFCSLRYYTALPHMPTNTYSVYNILPPSRGDMCQLCDATCVRTSEQSGNQISQLTFQQHCGWFVLTVSFC